MARGRVRDVPVGCQVREPSVQDRGFFGAIHRSRRPDPGRLGLSRECRAKGCGKAPLGLLQCVTPPERAAPVPRSSCDPAPLARNGGLVRAARRGNDSALTTPCHGPGGYRPAAIRRMGCFGPLRRLAQTSRATRDLSMASAPVFELLSMNPPFGCCGALLHRASFYLCCSTFEAGPTR